MLWVMTTAMSGAPSRGDGLGSKRSHSFTSGPACVVPKSFWATRRLVHCGTLPRPGGNAVSILGLLWEGCFSERISIANQGGGNDARICPVGHLP